jgi:hypothetical protein
MQKLNYLCYLVHQHEQVGLMRISQELSLLLLQLVVVEALVFAED